MTKNSKMNYIFLIIVLCLLAHISLFTISHYPFTDVTNQEIISFFNIFFVISLSLNISISYKQPLITLFGSIVLSIIILFLLTTIVSFSENFAIFLIFCGDLLISVLAILVIIYDVKKGNYNWIN